MVSAVLQKEIDHRSACAQQLDPNINLETILLTLCASSTSHNNNRLRHNIQQETCAKPSSHASRIYSPHGEIRSFAKQALGKFSGERKSAAKKNKNEKKVVKMLQFIFFKVLVVNRFILKKREKSR